MQGPLVSVIMPLYNKKPYAARSIKSVTDQTYKNWELIIVDDGSTDGSSDVVPMDDSRIRLIRQENRGPAAARNKAASTASGEYLAFIDADDRYYPFKLEREIEFLWKENAAEWMMSAYDYLKDEITRRYYIKDINGAEIRGERRVFDDAFGQLKVAGWPSDGLFMKKTLFDCLSGFNESMRYGEITELILRCAAMQPKVGICGFPLYLHIDVPGSTAKVTKKNEYPLQLGRTLNMLAQKYPKYGGYLISSGYANLISYCAFLILEGRGAEARRFLRKEFSLKRDVRWWKMWAASFLPKHFILNLVKIFRETNKFILQNALRRLKKIGSVILRSWRGLRI